MGLLSIFRRDAATADGERPVGEDPSDAVREARTRARRRLIGAVVLLAIGVIGFPLVFETRPRPIPVDIPIEIPKRDAVPPLTMPPPRGADAAVPAPGPRDEQPSASKGEESAAPSSRAAAATHAASHPAEALAEPTVSRSRPSKTEAHAEAEKARKGASTSPQATLGSADSADQEAKRPAQAEAERARAILDARPANAEGARFVVQVGAFADADAARQTRARVERLGLKTYTQVARTSAGDRIRVRVGPFSSRAEADAALAKARGAGLTAVVLTL